MSQIVSICLIASLATVEFLQNCCISIELRRSERADVSFPGLSQWPGPFTGLTAVFAEKLFWPFLPEEYHGAVQVIRRTLSRGEVLMFGRRQLI